MPRIANKSENKAKDEKVKPIKELSPKRLMEADHLAGRHKEAHGNCEMCNRRNSRTVKKLEATKRFLASKK